MKKILFAVLAVVFCSAAVFADIAVKLGGDLVGYVKIDEEAYVMKVGANVAAEYLYPVNDMIKVGAGVEYLFPREVDLSP